MAALLLSLSLLLALATTDAAALSTPKGGRALACPCHDVDPRTDFFVPFREGKDLTCLCVFVVVGGGRGSETKRARERERTTTTTTKRAHTPLNKKTNQSPPPNNSDQSQKGGCGQAFMKSAIAEVGEYCQISCGSCPCCSPLIAAAEQIGGGEFAWAFNASLPWLVRDRAPLSAPGFMATVLVPPDRLMADAIARLGGRAAVSSSDAQRAALTALVATHIVKPNSEFNAVWTSPFLRRAGGWTLQTYADGVGLQVKTEEGDGAVVFAPVLLPPAGGGGGGGAGKEGAASARMASRDSGRLDVEACKGVVIGVDQVILPYVLP
jgi:hypothetical protein